MPTPSNLVVLPQESGPTRLHAPSTSSERLSELAQDHLKLTEFSLIRPKAPKDTLPCDRPIVDFVQFFTLEDADYTLAARAHHCPSSKSTINIVNVTSYAAYLLLRRTTLDIVNALRSEASKRRPYYQRPIQAVESVFSSLIVHECTDFAFYTQSEWNPTIREPEGQSFQVIYNLLVLRGYHDYLRRNRRLLVAPLIRG